VLFSMSTEDARVLARHVALELSAYDLSHFGGLQAASRLVVAGEEARLPRGGQILGRRRSSDDLQACGDCSRPRSSGGRHDGSLVIGYAPDEFEGEAGGRVIRTTGPGRMANLERQRMATSRASHGGSSRPSFRGSCFHAIPAVARDVLVTAPQGDRR
jgi:hypothetical protein